MALVPLTELLTDARDGGYAVGYFEAWDAYSLEAVLEAAEAERAPVILGFGCLLVDQDWLDDGGIETLAALSRAAAARSRVPVSLLLNEAHTTEHALRGADAGFNAVMLSSGDMDTVAALVGEAHRRGVSVEGELGTLPDAGDASHASPTDPEEARVYVEATGVDCLAVSFGNVHVLEGRNAEVDLDRLEAIHRNVDVPLTVHGGTSFPPDAVEAAIARGAAKFNVGTVLKRAFLDGLTAAVASAPADASPHDLLGSHGPADLLETAGTSMIQVVRDRIRLYGGSGRGA
jgi:ketose-bisphosphate aldolase